MSATPSQALALLTVIVVNLTRAAGWGGGNGKGLQILQLAEGKAEAHAEVWPQNGVLKRPADFLVLNLTSF